MEEPLEDDKALEVMAEERDDCIDELLEESAEKFEADSELLEAEIGELNDAAMNELFDRLERVQQTPESPNQGVGEKRGSIPTNARQKLFEFFKKRVNAGDWKKTNQLPRRNADKEFDELLQELNLGENSPYASHWWLQFKKAEGIVPPFEKNLEKFKIEYSKRLDSILGLVVDNVSTAFQKYDFHMDREKVAAEFTKLLRRNAATELFQSHLKSFTELLTTALKGATVSTIDERMAVFEISCRKHLRREFLDSFTAMLPPRVKTEHGVVACRAVGNILHQILQKEWSRQMFGLKAPKPVESLDEVVVEDRLQQSKLTVYYVAGWLLRRLATARSVMRLPNDFIAYNTMEVERANEKMPSQSLNQRENVKGALFRPGTNWFRFICLLEALFTANITADSAMFYKGRLLEEITRIVRGSELLRQHFQACFPVHYGRDEKIRMWHLYYKIVIPCYTKIKSRNVIRRIKAGEKR